ncbi:30S ribosomal protein S4e [Candidatus Woesearchaeota archaeon]|nr:30S ribosomal protein S4e [Candidatus Woesearchaeota archaeon]
MGKDHLKRYAIPSTWDIKKKGLVFVTRPKPGSHSRPLSLPLGVVLKNLLKCVKTTNEAKKLLYNNEVLVDGRRVKDQRVPVGLMDVIHLKQTNQNFRIMLDTKGKLAVIEIDDKEAKLKISEIIGKTPIKGGKIQINLRDSRNIIAEKNDYKVGGSLMIEVPSQKIVDYFTLEKGAYVLLIAGKHISSRGVVESTEKDSITYNSEYGSTRKTLKKYAFAVGKGKPALKLN